MAELTSQTTIVVAFISVALYNFLELNVLVLSIFKSRRSLYFWSLVVATWGIAFNSIGYLLKDLNVTKNAYIYATLILIGWCSMITGQSVVLYSRLHLVMHNKKRLRAILAMIIINAIWLHIPVIVLVYGANSDSPKPYVRPYEIYEKIQLSVFFVQEVIISGFYVWETTKLLRMERTIGNQGKGIMLHLIVVNILVVLLDFTILGLEFANMYEIQTAWKPLVYSVKLKLEFSILNRLVHLTRSARSGNHNTYSRTGGKSEGVALGTLKGPGGSRLTAKGAEDQVTQYEVHVGPGKGNNESYQNQDLAVLRTTEFHISSHSRRRASKDSVAESEKILAPSAAHEDGVLERQSASSIASDVRTPGYEHKPWQH